VPINYFADELKIPASNCGDFFILYRDDDHDRDRGGDAGDVHSAQSGVARNSDAKDK